MNVIIKISRVGALAITTIAAEPVEKTTEDHLRDLLDAVENGSGGKIYVQAQMAKAHLIEEKNNNG